MLIPVPPQFRRRTRLENRPTAPATVPLTLVSASFTADPALVLVFDRAIDIAGLVGAMITVNDPVMFEASFVVISGVLLDPMTVQLFVTDTGPSSGTQAVLSAGAGNGIVAVDDGGTWSGVTDLVLPFP